ncbi:hypothetical protein O6P43_013632 [Quillaja saponaria]|uniref:Uncharacterized protein n=1 Tax=Quillaja saponaria TaxID=32244 RepID=A0AAD7LSZ7_QUISA|nr:hypothetical protein O6P43_013632 [Quillaja saponaria]
MFKRRHLQDDADSDMTSKGLSTMFKRRHLQDDADSDMAGKGLSTMWRQGHTKMGYTSRKSGTGSSTGTSTDEAMEALFGMDNSEPDLSNDGIRMRPRNTDPGFMRRTMHPTELEEETGETNGMMDHHDSRIGFGKFNRFSQGHRPSGSMGKSGHGSGQPGIVGCTGTGTRGAETKIGG